MLTIVPPTSGTTQSISGVVQNLAIRQQQLQQLQQLATTSSSGAGIPQIITNAQGQIVAIGTPQVSSL